MEFGQDGGLHEILYAGAGVLLVRREVYMAVQNRLQLPMCNERFDRPMIPFFQPLAHRIEDGFWYLAEDYAFCQRARECGGRKGGILIVPANSILPHQFRDKMHAITPAAP